ARPVRDEGASTGTCRCRPTDLPTRLRPTGTRPMVPHNARYANLDDGRARRRGAERRSGRGAGRYLRLFWRARGPGDPAADRVAAIGADDPDLACPLGRPAARLDADPGAFCDYGDPVIGRLDHARARGARPVSGTPRRRLRD